MNIRTGTPYRAFEGLREGVVPPSASLGDDGAREQFREAMEGAPSAQVPAVPSPAGADAGKPHTLGDAILSGVNRLSADFQHAWAQKNAGLNSDMRHWSSAQLVQFQAHVQTASAVLDVVGKGVSKVVQGIEQITKTQ